MDKENSIHHHHQSPSLLPNNTTIAAPLTAIPKEESPRKPFNGGGGNGGGDRLKRDEWSEGAVSSLLEAYESKWVLRNRAKLKGHDWEDVARYVSSRANSTKSPKTQTQCKNKIESMKKRYRSESTTDASSWPLYSRLDLLLRGNGVSPAVAAAAAAATTSSPAQPTLPPMPPSHLATNNPPLLLLEPTPVAVAVAPLPPPLPPPPPLPAPPPLIGTAQNSHGSNGVERLTKDDTGVGMNKMLIISDNASDKNVNNNNNNNNNNSMDITSDSSSTPALYSEKAEKIRRSSSRKKAAAAAGATVNKMIKRKRKRKQEELEVAESIRWLAEAVVKSEQARMEAMREIERMRVEAEAKRAEMELKRTEIIANTQLEIAKLFASVAHVGKPVDSSLRIGRN